MPYLVACIWMSFAHCYINGKNCLLQYKLRAWDIFFPPNFVKIVR